MNKCIIFAVLAFAACVAASPNAKGYDYEHSYHAPVYAKPIVSYAKPAAAAAAAAAASAPVSGYVHAVPSYTILGGHSGYEYGYDKHY